MNLKVRKSIIKYCLLLIIFLAPSRISNAFLPYSSYLTMIAQGGIGLYYIIKYKPSRNNSIFALLFVFLLSGCLGMIFVYQSDVMSFARYGCWALSLLGLFQYITRGSDIERKNLLETSRILFYLSYLFTIYYGMQFTDNMAYGTSVFFWGSEAVTTQAFIMFFSLSLYYDKEYKTQISIHSYIIGGLGLLFCVVNNSGQGISMFIVLIALIIINHFSHEYIWKILRPAVVIIVIYILYYLVITLRFTEFDFIVDYITNVLSKDITLTGRDVIFSASLEIFMQHAFIGYGYNNSIINDLLGSRVMQFNTAHNSMLQMLVDYGVVGVGIFTVLVYQFMKTMRRIPNDVSSRVLCFSVIAMFVGGLVNMIIPTNNFWIVIMFGASNWFKYTIDKNALDEKSSSLEMNQLYE